MQVVVHAPFGSLCQEAGAVFLLTRYLRKFFSTIDLLRCSGSFSLCDRDGEHQWKRELGTCFGCMNEQRELASWAEVSLQDLSSLLSASDLNDSLKWIWLTPFLELPISSFRDIQPYPLIRWSFRNRFGSEEPNQSNHNHEQVARRFALSALRAGLAANELVRRKAPELALIAGGQDYISASVASCMRARGVQTVIFRWDSAQRCVKVTHPRSGEQFSCGIVLENIVSMRADPKTWPLELLSIIEDVVAFLGLELHQLTLQPKAVGS